jgi:MoaA/NifB/PqqE/SkfB family radical SAM enzyme
MSFDTVDLLTGNIFQVTWDLGRRCNYDCTYCPAHRHDNFSKHATLDELKNSVDFLFGYIDTYMEHRHLKKDTSISFTGGEPTVNPNFIPFAKYLKEEYERRYKDKWHAGFALTSNGAFSQKMADAIIENMNHITVSFHTEADKKLKKNIIERILYIHRHNKGRRADDPLHCSISVNVMFHAHPEYFNECKELCELLHEEGVKYTPRVIGEEPDSASDFAHKYSQEQLDYMKNYWRNIQKKIDEKTSRQEVNHQTSAASKDKTAETKKLGMSIGRPCCGQREMCLSSQGQDRTSTFVDMREFKGWHCSVNWFFLHLEQQTDQVFHHQTCQAKFDGTRGPIGKISEGQKIIDDLKANMEAKTMPTVICPKHTCGCGLCAPKSLHKENYEKVLLNHVTPTVFENSLLKK